VNLKIPKIGKEKLGCNYLPCKILEVKPKGYYYELGCFAGKLNVDYKENSLN
jgi:hypothetical protein